MVLAMDSDLKITDLYKILGRNLDHESALRYFSLTRDLNKRKYFYLKILTITKDNIRILRIPKRTSITEIVLSNDIIEMGSLWHGVEKLRFGYHFNKELLRVFFPDTLTTFHFWILIQSTHGSH